MRQMTLDDEAKDLFNTKFLVIDVETTGTAPSTDEITEIAAVLIRGGKIIESFETLLSINGTISSEISVMTGIYPQMLRNAPRFKDIASKLIEMADGAVVVGHNIRFDLSFIDSALDKHYSGYHLAEASLDTVTLSRKLLRGEVPNFKLGTLASVLRLNNQPCHRAMADVRATVDLLHYLIEIAGTYGSHDVNSLIDLPNNSSQAAKSKLKISNYLPRLPGIYMMTDLAGEIYYIGKAVDLNARFRSYFSSDTRKKIDPMLRRLAKLIYLVTETDDAAEVLEARLISKYQPRQNSIGKKDPRNFRYVKVDTSAKRSKVVRYTDQVIDENFVGPFRSTKNAKEAAKCIDMCGNRLATDSTNPWDEAPLSTPLSLRELSVRVASRLELLVKQERFEDAALLRDGAMVIAGASVRKMAIDTLRRTESIKVVHREMGIEYEINYGLLRNPLLRGGEVSIHPTMNTTSAALLSEAQISEIISPKRSGLRSIEEEWTIWRKIISNPRFEVFETKGEIALPITLTHSNFTPKERDLDKVTAGRPS